MIAICFAITFLLIVVAFACWFSYREGYLAGKVDGIDHATKAFEKDITRPS